MATKKQLKSDIVYRGINLYESELQVIISSLNKAKIVGSKEIVKMLTRIVNETEYED